MAKLLLLWLTLIFVAPGCATTKDDILKALKRHETALCACKTEACARKAMDEASGDPILMEVGAADPMLLKARIGEKSYTAFETQWDACRNRLIKPGANATK